MLRAVIRNLILAFAVGLPVLITAGAVIAWLFPPVWAGSNDLAASASGFAAGFAFWYVILALPVAAFAVVHQTLLALLVYRTRRSTERVHSVAIALGMSFCVGTFVGATSSAVNWVGLFGTLLIASTAYGFVTRPLSTAEGVRDAAV